jgi:hypothetical protein
MMNGRRSIKLLAVVAVVMATVMAAVMAAAAIVVEVMQ